MKTVLLIEDNRDIRENTGEILELANYSVLLASNGKEGVEMALHHKPDIIICDIMMPELDGYGVIHLLQKNKETKNTPFIFITAKTERSEIRKGMELGADDYITKPFNGTELLNAVESRLKKADALKLELSPNLEGLNTLISSAGGKDILQALVDNNNIHTYKKKQVIYAERNHAYRLYYIQKGKVKTYKTNNDGKDLITGVYSEGDFFGYTALLENSLYKESAEAIEEAEIAAIPKEDFMDLINSNRDIMMRFVKLLAGNVSEREEQLLGLAYNSLRKKVAEALIMLYKKYKAEDDTPCVIQMNRENLAAIAGTAKESLIRTLSDFKDEKLIEVQDGDIVILNEKKLRNLIN